MPRPGTSHVLLPAIDSSVVLGLALGAIVWANDQQLPIGGFTELLATRVTLLNAGFAAMFALLWRQCLTVLGLYRRDLVGLYQIVMRTAGACVIMTTLLALYLDARPSRRPVAQIVVAFLIVAFVYEICRVLVSSRNLNWHVGEPERVIILGSGPRASKAWREVRIQCRRTKRLLGFVDNRHTSAMAPDIAGRFLGSVEDLPGYLLRNAVDELIVATPMRSCFDMTQQAVSIAEAAGVRVVFLSDVYTLTHEKSLRQRATLFVELIPKDEKRETAEAAKRVLDVLGAAAGLALLAPLFLVIGVAVRITSPGPAFFVQERYGYRRRLFQMYKFRTMVRNASELMEQQDEAHGPIFNNDSRVTPLGRFLRRTLLDELPQLWNVLLGDMSLVGPRPMTVRYVLLFSEAQLMRRFSVRPGMTGVWQVAGRSSFSFDQWLALDFSYIDEWSLLLDLKILARTVPALFRRAGAV